MGHAEVTCQPLDLARFARGLWPQAMVDRHRQEIRAVRERLAPARREPHQGHGIRTT
jgi:hypothetical protein